LSIDELWEVFLFDAGYDTAVDVTEGMFDKEVVMCVFFKELFIGTIIQILQFHDVEGIELLKIRDLFHLGDITGAILYECFTKDLITALLKVDLEHKIRVLIREFFYFIQGAVPLATKVYTEEMVLKSDVLTAIDAIVTTI